VGAVFQGPTSKGRKRKGGGEREKNGEGKGRAWREDDLTHPLSQIPGYATATHWSYLYFLLLIILASSCIA